MSKVVKSEAIKRISVFSVQDLVDAAMEGFPYEFDTTLPENRQKIRNWMVRVCGVVLEESRSAFTSASSSAMEEVANLARNPDFYEVRKKNRAARAEKRKRTIPEQRARQAFVDLTGGKVQ